MSVTTVPIRPLAKGSVAKLWIGLLILAVASGALAWAGTSGQQRETTESGLQIRVLKEGEGPTVTTADLVALNYRLTKEDGTLIQDSRTTGQPFVTGTEGVFPGFAEGLQRMRAGGQYVLYLPPGLHVSQPLGPGAPFTPEDTLVFEIEVLQIAPGMAAMQQLMGPPGASSAPPAGALPPEGAHPTDGEESPPADEPTGNSQR